jgi:hypothetical protein
MCRGAQLLITPQAGKTPQKGRRQMSNANKVTEIAMINTTARKGQHVRFAVRHGRCIPPSKAMLQDFSRLDVLGKPDIDFIRSVLPTATFRPTKSGQFVRLNEFAAFKAALAARL